MHQFVQQLINGLSSGAIYALIAVGYTMVYGVLRLINFAHGDIYMFGAMMGLYVCTNSFNLIDAGRSHPIFWSGLTVLALVVLALVLLLKRAGRRQPGWLGWLATVVGAIVLAVIVMDLGGRAIRAIGLPSWVGLVLAIAVAMTVCACLGVVIERVAYRPLRDRPRITSLITAIGISMFLEFGGQGIFGVDPHSFPHTAPIAESASLALNPPAGAAREIPPTFTINLTHLWPAVGKVEVAWIDAIIILITLVLMAILTWIVLRTRTGLALRAVSHRFDTAALMGIDIDRIIAFTFALGSSLAGAAGVLIAVRSPVVDPLMGLMPGIKAFVAAVLGGIGNIPGAVAGGFLLGIIEVLVSSYLPEGSQYRDAIAFVILIAILLAKPTGLFGRNIVEKV